MASDERRTVLRRFTDEAWNNGRIEACDALYAAHCSFHDPSFPVEGVAGLKQQIEQLRHAQPDLHMEVHDILVDGDLTVARWTIAGTARNEFRGLPPTGKTYVMTGMTCDKWDADRIVEEWVNYDLLGALQQLGIIPENMEETQSTA